MPFHPRNSHPNPYHHIIVPSTPASVTRQTATHFIYAKIYPSPVILEGLSWMVACHKR